MSFSNIADLCVVMTTVFAVFSLMAIAFIAICINAYLALRAAYDKTQDKAKKKAFIAGWNRACKNSCTHNTPVTYTIPVTVPVTVPSYTPVYIF